MAAMVVSTPALFGRAASYAIIAIDIPIGLADDCPRETDCLARGLLGHPRASSVFPAPVRAALDATSYVDASERSAAACGKRLSRQAYAILPKIREVDVALRESPDLANRFREVHPEVSFYFLNGQRAMEHSKRSQAGRAERIRVLQPYFGQVVEGLRARLPRAVVATDDILDALVALWTAERVASGRHVSLQRRPIRDRHGLPMAIVG